MRAGASVSTDTLDIIFQPSFAAVVNYTNSSKTGHDTKADSVTNTLQFAVSATLHKFLFDYSELTARYGNISDGRSGYEVIWNYYDLEMAYGAFVNDGGAGSSFCCSSL
ncbi:MAG: hypothetical protein R2865_00260 [Deinococcales bacterium]